MRTSLSCLHVFRRLNVVFCLLRLVLGDDELLQKLHHRFLRKVCVLSEGQRDVKQLILVLILQIDILLRDELLDVLCELVWIHFVQQLEQLVDEQDVVLT